MITVNDSMEGTRFFRLKFMCVCVTHRERHRQTYRKRYRETQWDK